MKNFFRNWRSSLISIFIFLLILFLLVRFVIINDFYDPFIFDEYEILIMYLGFLMGLLGFFMMLFIGSFIGDIIDFAKSRFDKRNHSTKNVDENK